jgi:AbrB family looped-hinge helix DNA binding protein
MRITTKGQVTIPVHIRERLGLLPNSDVDFLITGNTARLRKSRRGASRGRQLVARLKGRGDVRLTTDQIMALTRKLP